MSLPRQRDEELLNPFGVKQPTNPPPANSNEHNKKSIKEDPQKYAFYCFPGFTVPWDLTWMFVSSLWGQRLAAGVDFHWGGKCLGIWSTRDVLSDDLVGGLQTSGEPRKAKDSVKLEAELIILRLAQHTHKYKISKMMFE